MKNVNKFSTPASIKHCSNRMHAASVRLLKAKVSSDSFKKIDIECNFDISVQVVANNFWPLYNAIKRDLKW